MRGNDLAGRAFQIIIIVGFHTENTGVVGIGKADDMAGKAPVRVRAFDVLFQMDADNLIFVYKNADLVTSLAFYFFLDDLIFGFGSFHALQNFRTVNL